LTEICSSIQCKKSLIFSYSLMQSSLLHVKVCEKHQITLPMHIVKAAHIRKNDTLSIAYKNGTISLKLPSMRQSNHSIMKYAGITQ
jgi:bifunctional DNA-binding transcriptional regulator/antitoxin component of YhaV-PrlF toxin-antitoxin module